VREWFLVACLQQLRIETTAALEEIVLVETDGARTLPKSRDNNYTCNCSE
jgi:hypothetical protein